MALLLETAGRFVLLRLVVVVAAIVPHHHLLQPRLHRVHLGKEHVATRPIVDGVFQTAGTVGVYQATSSVSWSQIRMATATVATKLGRIVLLVRCVSV